MPLFHYRKKKTKKDEKGVDKVGRVWYYNIAVTEDRKNKEMRRNIERVAGAKTSKKLRKKYLTN